MARHPWHILRDGPIVTLARHLPVRFDLLAETRLPGEGGLSRGRLAHQVRQDIWRALQAQRGFSPVVRVTREDATLRIEAGGRIEGARAAPAARDALAAVLADPANRRRWLRHAGARP